VIAELSTLSLWCRPWRSVPSPASRTDRRVSPAHCYPHNRPKGEPHRETVDQRTNFDYPAAQKLAARLKTLAEEHDAAGMTIWVGDNLIQPTRSRRLDPMIEELHPPFGFPYTAAAHHRVRWAPGHSRHYALRLCDQSHHHPRRALRVAGRGWASAPVPAARRRRMDCFCRAVPERVIRRKETLRLAAQLWTGDPDPLIGR